MLKEGMIVGERYEIIGQVGSGGMADVYKARDHKLNRMVAFKVLKAEFSGDTNFVNKFQREAQAAARLSHPNIVNVYDVGEDNGINYIVMELVEGITLKDYITRKGKLSIREATSIAIQVSLGLEAAHNSGIIHRDVKPQNIIISIDGKVKLSDFGIARATSSNTISTNMMGSVHYSSPEQVRGGYSDAKSDIYSLGITMYEMVTGRVPFDGESTVAIAIKHLQEEMEAPSKYAQIPHSLEQIILKCTQKSVDRRYNTMSEVVDDLKHSLIDPDGDFVRLAPLSSHAQTIMISPEEMQAIREGHTGNVPVVKPESDADYYKRKYEEYDNQKKQYPGYDEDDEYEYDEDDEEDDDGVSSKLEKAMTIGGFIIGGIIIVILIFFIGKAAGIFKFGGSGTTPTPTVTEAPDDEDTVEVPNVLGMTEDEAKKALNEVGLGYKPAGEESSDKYDEGQIMYQNIAAGEKVAKNSTIECKISNGKMADDEVELPSVLNNDQTDAEKTLKELGLETKIETQNSDTVEIGKVISMSPGAGETVKKGDTVTLVISKGPQDMKVPDVTGESQESATAALEAMGLKVTVKEKASEDVDKGNVVSTSPAAGSSVKNGDTVTIYISTGADKVMISNYVGLSADQAERELTDQGFEVKIQYSVSGSGKEGTVLSMNPAGGQKVKVGSTITLTVKQEESESSDPSTDGSKSGNWKCNAQLTAPDNYQGGTAKLVLVQEVNGEKKEEVLVDGEAIEFPYLCKETGYDGVSTGIVYLYENGKQIANWTVNFKES